MARLRRFPSTLPLQTESLALPLPLPLPLQLPLLSLIRAPAPKVFPMRRHAIRDFPPPLVELDRLRGFDAAHEGIALHLARRAERFDLPALVRVCDDLAVRRAVPVRLDRGVAAFDERLFGEDGVAADGVHVEAVTAHF